MAITKLESARDYFRIWYFWKRHVIFIFLLIVGLVMFYAYTTTPLYESSAKILVLPKTNEGEIISARVDEKSVNPLTREDISTEMELISSDPVMQDTVMKYLESGISLSDSRDSILSMIIDPIKNTFNGLLNILKLTSSLESELEAQSNSLKNSLKIEAVVGTNVIKVALRGEQSARATQLLSEILENYLKHRKTVFTKEKGLNFYADQMLAYKTKLGDIEGKLKEFKKDANIVNLIAQNDANIKLLTTLNNELKLLQISYDEGHARTTMLKNIILNDSSEIHLTSDMRTIPAIMELEKGIVPLLIKRSEINKTYTITSREFISINDQIAMLRNEIREEIEKAIRTDELELQSMNIKIVSLKDLISLLLQESTKLNQKEKQLFEMERQRKIYQDGFLLYSGKTEDAKIFKDKSSRDLSNVSISSPPTTMKNPVFPNRMLMLNLSIFFGLFAGFFIPFVLETLDNKIKTSDDVEILLNLPVVCIYSDVKKS